MTATATHQVRIPKKVREALGIQPGDPLKWIVTPNGALLVLDKTRPRGSDIVKQLRGRGNGRYSTASLLKLTRA